MFTTCTELSSLILIFIESVCLQYIYYIIVVNENKWHQDRGHGRKITDMTCDFGFGTLGFFVGLRTSMI